MPPAIIAAGVGAVASIGGGLLSASAQKKATSKATAAAAQGSAANIAAAEKNYAQNAQRLDPYSNMGLRAGGALNDMLLGPQRGGALAQYGQPVAANDTDWVGYVNANPDALANWNAVRNTSDGQQFGGKTAAFGQYHYGADGSQRDLTAFQPQQGQQGALSPFDQYRNSTNYRFRVDEGNRGLNQGYAANGMLESGAAIKGFADYNQNMAMGALGEFQDRLAQQQQIGVGAAGALAGVGNATLGAVTSANNNRYDAQANAALINGQAKGNMFGSIAGALGSAAGAIGSSYARPAPPPAMIAPQFNGLSRGFG